ncbi:isoleucine--tRNA ligase, chloroplastic/mitochondrial isoform X1 [Amborella trichopoda]|uniref:isoleucine--tRNA ligase, chloroplastic/mitochondrial isoform X1 n=1 Tax=Amborella trichopoda TaxID=13333 RepID=UPI0009C07040|nr:isoleucine--tRNA ligase, chloroplastic/mitochondrial isoform X1 [Amborella trichopoda]|eukprot:XP_011621916.2 isoleucine--tRNA ligase, chloroplastic/mitochondrial isoform X1 [Amborella trichopoda]
MDSFSLLKSATNPVIMAVHASSCRAISQRTFSTFRCANVLTILPTSRRSFKKNFIFLKDKSLSTCSSEDFGYTSKRRARGPVMAAKKLSEGAQKEDGKYKHTVDLPKTSFGLRANAVMREPEIQKLWEDNEVLKRVVDRNNRGSFVLHDGPPYANGDLHIGHALNKILKDIVNRYKLLQGYKVHSVPGWDCHGLPIELKVLQSLDQDARKELTPIKLRKKATKFAKDTVDVQRKSFKRYGVWGDWSNPYLTLTPEYEAAQIEVFGQMAMKGYIYRGLKPVHWSPSSCTALAEAELEYPDGHISKSIYAIFKVVHVPENAYGLFGDFLPNLSLVIWTTTPWTIPGNVAVSVNAELLYAVIEVTSLTEGGSTSQGSSKLGKIMRCGKKVPYLIVATERVPALQSMWNAKIEVKKTFRGSELENCRYVHPVDGRENPVVLGGDYITAESGTGLVHTAPGHGPEDYATGLKYGLPVLSPVDDNGIFTEEAGRFSGLDVLGEGTVAIANYLDDQMSILLEESYEHKYPYDWRTKKPTIFRATEQWFASVEGFRQATMDAINQITWIPEQGKNRIAAMASTRADWCISRQRSWGVPIPCFYHVQSREPLMNKETIDHIKSIILEKGSDAWWYMTTEELLPEAYHKVAADYQKGTDTMDVWFDSGSSWAAVLEKRDGLNCPADLYLEGSDQHRGWFQSSLLTCIATRGKAPYRSVLTHGFVLDEKGLKMSKSMGNVVDPRTVIEGGKNPKDAPGYGADALRLWVSSVDYSGDVLIGSQILRQMSDIYRKLRGTLRYLLANLHDWKPEASVGYSELPMIDKHALFHLGTVVNSIKDHYETYQFCKIFQIVQRFAIVDLSNFYFDVAKDRLYVGGTTSLNRRSCQTVLAAHLLCIVRVIAPILPHLAEDVWQHLPFQHMLQDGSIAEFVFESRWPDLNKQWLGIPAEEVDYWGKLLELRGEVNKVLETARVAKAIGSSLDAKVYFYTSHEGMASKLYNMCFASCDADRLHRIFITSQAEVLSSLDDDIIANIPYTGEFDFEGKHKIWIGVSRAGGEKCERCWNYTPQVGSFMDHPTLCWRCYHAVVGSQPLAAVAGAH